MVVFALAAGLRAVRVVLRLRVVRGVALTAGLLPVVAVGAAVAVEAGLVAGCFSAAVEPDAGAVGFGASKLWPNNKLG